MEILLIGIIIALIPAISYLAGNDSTWEVLMAGKDDRKNPEGYLDLTAYEAIKEADKDKDAERFHRLLDVIFSVCELSGFHVEGRIVVRDKRTGRVWR